MPKGYHTNYKITFNLKIGLSSIIHYFKGNTNGQPSKNCKRKYHRESCNTSYLKKNAIAYCVYWYEKHT